MSNVDFGLKLVTCPYDPVHKLKESRMQMHIVKCRMNHLHEEKFECPFNRTHIYPMAEKSYHIQNCPDAAFLINKLSQSVDRNNPYKGRTAVPSYDESHIPPSGETWDVDEYSTSAGYVPKKEPPGGICMPNPLSKPAERRQLYRDLHLKNKDEKFSSYALAPSTEEASANSLPSHSSHVPPPINNNQNLNDVGMGRGRGSRIAANFQSATAAQNGAAAPRVPGEEPWTRVGRATPHYQQGASNMSSVTKAMDNLGLGRGTQLVNRAAEARQPNFDDDFPALGMGRGMRQPKKN